MDIREFEGKNFEELLSYSLTELNVREDEIIYKKEEIKGNLFKGTSYKISVVLLTDIASFIKSELTKILSHMEIDASFETKIRSGKVQVKMYSDKNSILIGKDGKTLDALQTVLRQVIYNNIQMYPYFILDVENYKEKQVNILESTVKKIAKEVANTKIDAVLEDMNSYERRIVHNCLTNYGNVYTISEGEEPNRHIVIKYKETEE